MKTEQTCREIENKIEILKKELSELENLKKDLEIRGSFFQTAINALPCPVFYKDINGRYQAGNIVWCENIIGLPIEDIINKTVYQLGDRMPKHLAEEYDKIDKSLLESGGDCIYEAKVKCASNEVIDFVFHKKVHYDSNGSKIGIIGTMIDVSESNRLKKRLQDKEIELLKANDILETILFSLPQGIIIVDALTHNIMDINPQACLLIGLPSSDVIGKKCHEFVCPNRENQCPITDLRKSLENSETVLLANDGKRIPILKTVIRVDLDGKDCLLEAFVDISEIKKLENRLTVLATTDELTGLLNRRHLFHLTDREINRSIRYATDISFAVIDIDNFKVINDTYGHPTGDAVLKSVSQLLNRCVRENDILGRIGGEEFALTMLNCDIKVAEVVAERIRNTIERNQIAVDQQRIKCTISIGISQLAKDETDSGNLFKRADKALYCAKQNGKNCVVTRFI